MQLLRSSSLCLAGFSSGIGTLPLRWWLERTVLYVQMPIMTDGAQIPVQLVCEQAAVRDAVVLALLLIVMNGRGHLFGGLRIDVALLQRRKNGLDDAPARGGVERNVFDHRRLAGCGESPAISALAAPSWRGAISLNVVASDAEPEGIRRALLDRKERKPAGHRPKGEKAFGRVRRIVAVNEGLKSRTAPLLKAFRNT